MIDNTFINISRTKEEIFKDGQMHEWLISHNYKLKGTTYEAPFGANSSELEIAHKRIFGFEIATTKEPLK